LHFYARKLAQLAIARISYGNSVLVSVTTRYRSEPRWDKDFWFLRAKKATPFSAS